MAAQKQKVRKHKSKKSSRYLDEFTQDHEVHPLDQYAEEEVEEEEAVIVTKKVSPKKSKQGKKTAKKTVSKKSRPKKIEKVVRKKSVRGKTLRENGISQVAIQNIAWALFRVERVSKDFRTKVCENGDQYLKNIIDKSVNIANGLDVKTITPEIVLKSLRLMKEVK